MNIIYNYIQEKIKKEKPIELCELPMLSLLFDDSGLSDFGQDVAYTLLFEYINKNLNLPFNKEIFLNGPMYEVYENKFHQLCLYEAMRRKNILLSYLPDDKYPLQELLNYIVCYWNNSYVFKNAVKTINLRPIVNDGILT